MKPIMRQAPKIPEKPFTIVVFGGSSVILSSETIAKRVEAAGFTVLRGEAAETEWLKQAEERKSLW